MLGKNLFAIIFIIRNLLNLLNHRCDINKNLYILSARFVALSSYIMDVIHIFSVISPYYTEIIGSADIYKLFFW